MRGRRRKGNDDMAKLNLKKKRKKRYRIDTSIVVINLSIMGGSRCDPVKSFSSGTPKSLPTVADDATGKRLMSDELLLLA